MLPSDMLTSSALRVVTLWAKVPNESFGVKAQTLDETLHP